MAKKKDIHVVPHQSGWAAKREGASRAGSVHSTQQKAITAATKALDRARAAGHTCDVTDSPIRDLIADTLAEAEKSYNLPAVCERLGLAGICGSPDTRCTDSVATNSAVKAGTVTIVRDNSSRHS